MICKKKQTKKKQTFRPITNVKCESNSLKKVHFVFKCELNILKKKVHFETKIKGVNKVTRPVHRLLKKGMRISGFFTEGMRMLRKY